MFLRKSRRDVGILIARTCSYEVGEKVGQPVVVVDREISYISSCLLAMDFKIRQQHGNPVRFCFLDRSVSALKTGRVDECARPSQKANYIIVRNDTSGNVSAGDVLIEDRRDYFIRSNGRLVAALGVDNLIVVANSDAVLVSQRDRDQSVKRVVNRLIKAGRFEASRDARVYPLGGFFEMLHLCHGALVKLIEVNRGATLSLLYHHKRAKDWVVVSGDASIIRGDDNLVLKVNKCTFIPIGMQHRLENLRAEPLRIIEVQVWELARGARFRPSQIPLQAHAPILRGRVEFKSMEQRLQLGQSSRPPEGDGVIVLCCAGPSLGYNFIIHLDGLLGRGLPAERFDHAIASCLAHFTALLRIGAEAIHRSRNCRWITRLDENAGFLVDLEGYTAHARCNDRQTAAHSFKDDEGQRVGSRWEHKNVDGSIERPQLLFGDKIREPDAWISLSYAGAFEKRGILGL